MHGVWSTDTIEFVTKLEVPQGRDVTHATFVYGYRPLKMRFIVFALLLGG